MRDFFIVEVRRTTKVEILVDVGLGEDPIEEAGRIYCEPWFKGQEQDAGLEFRIVKGPVPYDESRK